MCYMMASLTSVPIDVKPLFFTRAVGHRLAYHIFHLSQMTAMEAFNLRLNEALCCDSLEFKRHEG